MNWEILINIPFVLTIAVIMNLFIHSLRSKMMSGLYYLLLFVTSTLIYALVVGSIVYWVDSSSAF